jgi:hypothetical protein
LKGKQNYFTSKTLSPTSTLALYVAVNSEVIGLAPEFTTTTLEF